MNVLYRVDHGRGFALAGEADRATLLRFAHAAYEMLSFQSELQEWNAFIPLPAQSLDGGLSRKTSTFDIETSSKRHEAFNVGA